MENVIKASNEADIEMMGGEQLRFIVRALMATDRISDNQMRKTIELSQQFSWSELS